MAAIQKCADELKPGDVIVASESGDRLLVTRAQSGAITALLVVHVERNDGKLRIVEIPRDYMYAIEAPDLTPAQQYAEELVELLEHVRERVVDPAQLMPQRIKALLDKIKPPEPPTLAEALDLVGVLALGHSVEREKRAHDLINRARRAGVIQ